MDSDRLSRWLAIAANFGVIVGLFLLIIEIQQNTEMMRGKSYKPTKISAWTLAPQNKKRRLNALTQLTLSIAVISTRFYAVDSLPPEGEKVVPFLLLFFFSRRRKFSPSHTYMCSKISILIFQTTTEKGYSKSWTHRAVHGCLLFVVTKV